MESVLKVRNNLTGVIDYYVIAITTGPMFFHDAHSNNFIQLLDFVFRKTKRLQFNTFTSLTLHCLKIVKASLRKYIGKKIVLKKDFGNF